MKPTKPKAISLNNIRSIINCFEDRTKPVSPLLTKDPSAKQSANGKFRKSIGEKRSKSKAALTAKQKKMVEAEDASIDEGDDQTEACDPIDVGETSLIVPPRGDNAQKRQMNIVTRYVSFLLHLPFFSSINRAGLATFSCVFFAPRFITQLIFYPIFRLVFGTLYPAYASYKAVRNKEVKDYVSESL